MLDLQGTAMYIARSFSRGTVFNDRGNARFWPMPALKEKPKEAYLACHNEREYNEWTHAYNNK